MAAIRSARMLLVAAIALSACATVAPTMDPTRARLDERAHAAGLGLGDPTALAPSTIREVHQAIGDRGEPLERLRRLDEWLRHGRGEFEYVAGQHLTAQQAFEQRRGDCMSYALLFRAAARGLGISTGFLHATEVLTHQERDGWFYVSSHVAVGYGLGAQNVVFDFADGRLTSWRLSPYGSIDDGTAMVLHYSNVAASWMAAGRLSLARRLLEVLVEAAPAVPEPLNNLAVVENRLGRHDQALKLLERALSDFPEYPPLYVNALHAAMAAGRPDVARQIEGRGQEIAARDPFFLFARGRRLFEMQRFVQAAEQFAAAASAEPKSALLQAWLARAYLSAGDYERGRDAWQRARKLGPSIALVLDLERQFPELATAAAEP